MSRNILLGHTYKLLFYRDVFNILCCDGVNHSVTQMFINLFDRDTSYSVLLDMEHIILVGRRNIIAGRTNFSTTAYGHRVKDHGFRMEYRHMSMRVFYEQNTEYVKQKGGEIDKRKVISTLLHIGTRVDCCVSDCAHGALNGELSALLGDDISDNIGQQEILTLVDIQHGRESHDRFPTRNVLSGAWPLTATSRYTFTLRQATTYRLTGDIDNIALNNRGSLIINDTHSGDWRTFSSDLTRIKCHSRPCLTNTIAKVTPKTSHLNAVKRIFKYLKGKPNLGLWYPRESPFDLEAFSDSDYGGSNLDRKSTTGGCQFLGQRLISWQCKKQTIVATSTTEAEYVAAANCCGQVLWVQNQLLDYGFNFMNTKIHIDNESTICIVKNPVYHSKTKHIEIRHHFIRDCYEKKLISVEKIHTDLNVADLLTKPFDGPRFNYLVVSIGFAEIVDFLRGSNLRYALTSNPTIYDSLVKQFWHTATANTIADGTLAINATIDTIRYTITEASIRDTLHLEDATWITILPNDEIFEGMGQMGSKSGGWDQFGQAHDDVTQTQPSSSSPPVHSPPHIPATIPTPTHIPETEPEPFEHTFEEPSPLISRIDSLETDLKQTKLTMGNAIVKLVKKVKKLEGILKRRNVVLSDSEEEEPEAQGRKSQDDPLASLVQGLVTPSMTKVNASGEEQVEDISPNTLEAAKTLSRVASLKPKSIDKGRRYKRRKETKGKKVVSSLVFQEEVDTGAEEVNTAEGVNAGSIKLSTVSEQVSTGNEQVSTVSAKKSTPSPDKGQRAGKAPMIIEETPKKSKEQILQEEASLAEAIRLDSLQKEEEAKQIHLDSLLAQRIAEEEELNEQQKKRKAQVQFEAQHYTDEDWDLIRAKIEANAELSKSMLGSDLQGEDFAKKMVDLVNQRKKYFAEERARAKRNKPMTQSQLKTYMMNYLKNQGTWKLSQLKNLSFEEVKEEFDKLVKQVELFAPMNFEATKASLKRFGEELQTKTSKRLKSDEAKDDEPTKKSGKRRKQMARKGLHTDIDKDDSEGSDEVSEQDDSVTGTKIPINPVPVAMKSPSIATYKIIKQGEKGVYQIVREDGTDIVYINFGAMLKDISRDDLTELYRIVMNRYGMDGPEDELEKVFWKYLKNMFEEPLSTDPIWSALGQQRIISWRYYDACRVHCLNLESMDIYMLIERKYPLSAEICKAMLDKKLQGGKPNEGCYKMLKMMEKQAGIRK
ncbi:hypothetical protein Tco_1353672 [Tanacetum coccineum]